MKLFISKKEDLLEHIETYFHKSNISPRGTSETYREAHCSAVKSIREEIANILLSDVRIYMVRFSPFKIEIFTFKPFTIKDCEPLINKAFSRYLPIVWEK